MNKYLGQGDIVFSATLDYFLTWTNALHLNTFGAREFFFILWAFLLNFVTVVALLWVATRITKKPIFGQLTVPYYPLKPMILVSLAISLVFGLLTYVTGEKEMTPQRIATYVVGLILGTGVTTWAFYQLTKKKKS